VLATTVILTVSGLIIAASVAWIIWLRRDLPSNDTLDVSDEPAPVRRTRWELLSRPRRAGAKGASETTRSLAPLVAPALPTSTAARYI
jgi:hypothetical protein